MAYQVKVLFKSAVWQRLDGLAVGVPSFNENGFVVIHWVDGRWTWISRDEIHAVDVAEEE